MNDYLNGFFTSAPAERLYTGSAGLFPGARGIPTPLTDPTTGGSLAKWWKAACDELIAAIPSGQAFAWMPDDAKGNADALETLLAQLVGETSSKYLPSDLCDATVSALAKLAQSLPELKSLGGYNADLAAKVEAFANRTFSAVEAGAAYVENVARKGDLNSTVNDLRLRDVCGRIYELSGDPPDELKYASGDTPIHYLYFAARDIEKSVTLPVLGGHEEAPPSCFRLFESQIDEYSQPSTRVAAMLHMANLQERLAAATTAKVAAGESDAKLYVEMTAVVAETMRGVLGMPARGQTQHNGVMDGEMRAEQDASGEVATVRLRQRLREEGGEGPGDPPPSA